MAGLDYSLVPEQDAITREERERALCPICEGDYLAGAMPVCRNCEGDGE